MSYSIPFVIAKSLSRYLNKEDADQFLIAAKSWVNLPAYAFALQIEEFFDVNIVNENPLLSADYILFDYLESIQQSDSEFPQDDEMDEYIQRDFTDDDEIFWHRKVLEDSINTLEKQNQELQIKLHLIKKTGENLLKRDYEVVRILGEGGFGKVFLAKHVISGQYFAIKYLKNIIDKKQEDILREIQLLAKITHPHIISYYHSFVEDDTLYLVMEYCKFGSLSDRLRKSGRITPENIAWKFQELTKTLAYLHENSIYHHDIKPANILINKYSALKISDFGCYNTNVGTIVYQPPEFLDGSADVDDPRIDVFSLGVTILESALGYNPFFKVSEKERLQMLNNVDLPIRHLPFWLQEIILNATHTDLNLRYQNMREFHDALSKKNIPPVISSQLIDNEKIATKLATIIKFRRWKSARNLILRFEHLDNHLNFLIQSGKYHLSIHQIEKAKLLFEKAIQINDKAPIDKELAEIYLQNNEPIKAISILRNFLNRQFKDKEAHNQILHAYWLSGRFDLGLEQANYCCKVFPSEQVLQNNLELFKIVINENPKSRLRSSSNAFLEYNHKVVSENKPESWAHHGNPSLQSKLLFHEYKFASVDKSKNLIEISIAGQDYRTDKEIISFGRDEYDYNTFHKFEGNQVSRRHFVIVNMKNNVWLYDLDSTGVEVDGQNVDGKTFLLGRHEIEFGEHKIFIKTSADLLL